jgi:hypothetical protein
LITAALFLLAGAVLAHAVVNVLVARSVNRQLQAIERSNSMAYAQVYELFLARDAALREAREEAEKWFHLSEHLKDEIRRMRNY